MDRKQKSQMKQNDTHNVLVVGAGASGLMAALTAAIHGASVTVLEHMDMAGKKLMLTGSGKCNYTNTDLSEAHYHGDAAFVREVLLAFSAEDAISFFRERGIVPVVRQYRHDKGAYLYPASMEAVSVRDALLEDCLAHGVKFSFHTEVLSVSRHKTGKLIVQSSSGNDLADALIFATGSNAMPKTGSDSSIYPVLKALEVPFQPFYPALTSIRCTGKEDADRLRAVRGVRTDAAVSLEMEQGSESVRYQSTGEIQFNENSLSGIPVMQLSRYVPKALKSGAAIRLSLDFLPGMSQQEGFLFVQNQLAAAERRKAAKNHALCGFLPEKLAVMLANEAEKNLAVEIKKGKSSKNRFCEMLYANLRKTSFQVTGTGGFEAAQCAGGGVELSCVNPHTMAFRKEPGIYFAGELLDVDGDCGGYNLQWAWATGFIAGKAAAQTHWIS